MKPKIHVITLGVANLAKSTAFYRDGLHLPLRGLFGNDEEETSVAFFDLDGGIILALYPQPWLSKDAGHAAASPGPGAFSLGQLLPSKAAVDAGFAEARKAGARVVSPPVDRPWGGYSGYFEDPDGHLWELVWNPNIEVE